MDVPNLNTVLAVRESLCRCHAVLEQGKQQEALEIMEDQIVALDTVAKRMNLHRQTDSITESVESWIAAACTRSGVGMSDKLSLRTLQDAVISYNDAHGTDYDEYDTAAAYLEGCQ